VKFLKKKRVVKQNPKRSYDHNNNYYNSFVEYVLDQGLPLEGVRYEFWFIKKDCKFFYYPHVNLVDFIKMNSPTVLMSGNCDIEVNARSNGFNCMASGFNECVFQEDGYGFFVMMTDKGIWKVLGAVKKFGNDDELSLNRYLKPIPKKGILNKIFN